MQPSASAPKGGGKIKLLPLGMRRPRKPPKSSPKNYLFGQRSVHCIRCCARPGAGNHYGSLPQGCGGEFGVSGSEKIVSCPKCGTKYLPGGWAGGVIYREERIA